MIKGEGNGRQGWEVIIRRISAERKPSRNDESELIFFFLAAVERFFFFICLFCHHFPDSHWEYIISTEEPYALHNQTHQMERFMWYLTHVHLGNQLVDTFGMERPIGKKRSEKDRSETCWQTLAMVKVIEYVYMHTNIPILTRLRSYSEQTMPCKQVFILTLIRIRSISGQSNNHMKTWSLPIILGDVNTSQ